ncbi:THUMP domain-containing class I SAM-dependent RNA methyltransferase [Geopsychrobacter electrodiphilus]|uniref:THUMP domain-containing class I SAM-dependent RNA methyltransferase n=1 Tax=Geopsychrobacter electrodiphilus TaxID=225196 RepID=UPI0003707113|nr:class I SAM-dependent RNA methyltransferase [Geopsychrobacter electrodiphilus]
MAQPKFNCFAVTPPGAEEICGQELRALGLDPQVQRGGVDFTVIARDLYRANLWSRVASRVLVRMGQFKCRDFPELYKQLLKLPWGRFVRPGVRCSVRVSCQTSRLTHTGRISETVLTVVEKALGGASETSAFEQLIFVRFENDQCQISIDSSGELLHRRGYRKAMVAAPLRENLAAAILLKLGYDGRQPLVDAMTGSGTFAIEAALIAGGIAPGRLRAFAFMEWPHFRQKAWDVCLQEQGIQVEPAGLILALDSDPLAVAAARVNAQAVQVEPRIEFRQGTMQDLHAPTARGILVMNPPYGERLGDVAQLRPLYAAFGQLCRDVFKGWTIGWISADRRFEREAQLKCQRLWTFSNGGIKVDLRLRAVRASEKPETT